MAKAEDESEGDGEDADMGKNQLIKKVMSTQIRRIIGSSLQSSLYDMLRMRFLSR